MSDWASELTPSEPIPHLHDLTPTLTLTLPLNLTSFAVLVIYDGYITSDYRSWKTLNTIVAITCCLVVGCKLLFIFRDVVDGVLKKIGYDHDAIGSRVIATLTLNLSATLSVTLTLTTIGHATTTTPLAPIHARTHIHARTRSGAGLLSP